jgi:DNA-binding NtrC family response regulator
VQVQTAVVVAGLSLSGKNKQYSNHDNVRSSNKFAQDKHWNNDNKNDNISKNSEKKRKPQARLFVVDDDSDILYVLKHGLLKNGFLVDAFTNPEEALLRFKSNAHGFGVVISDIRMPGLSGIQLARKVKEINPDIKVVLMTAFEIKDHEFSKVFPSAHVDGFVQKPVSMADLTNKILDLIGETERKPSDG